MSTALFRNSIKPGNHIPHIDKLQPDELYQVLVEWYGGKCTVTEKVDGVFFVFGQDKEGFYTKTKANKKIRWDDYTDFRSSDPGRGLLRLGDARELKRGLSRIMEDESFIFQGEEEVEFYAEYLVKAFSYEDNVAACGSIFYNNVVHYTLIKKEKTLSVDDLSHNMIVLYGSSIKDKKRENVLFNCLKDNWCRHTLDVPSNFKFVINPVVPPDLFPNKSTPKEQKVVLENVKRISEIWKRNHPANTKDKKLVKRQSEKLIKSIVNDHFLEKDFIPWSIRQSYKSRLFEIPQDKKEERKTTTNEVYDRWVTHEGFVIHGSTFKVKVINPDFLRCKDKIRYLRDEVKKETATLIKVTKDAVKKYNSSQIVDLSEVERFVSYLREKYLGGDMYLDDALLSEADAKCESIARDITYVIMQQTASVVMWPLRILDTIRDEIFFRNIEDAKTFREAYIKHYLDALERSFLPQDIILKILESIISPGENE